MIDRAAARTLALSFITEQSPKLSERVITTCSCGRKTEMTFAYLVISRAVKLLASLRPQVRKLVSFADTTFNHNGTIYKATNWKHDGYVKPDYWYVNDSGWVMHKKKLYTMATKLKMKESEYAHKFGYTKMWGKRKIRFVREVNNVHTA